MSRAMKPRTSGLRASTTAADAGAEPGRLASTAPSAPVFEEFGFTWGAAFDDPMHFRVSRFLPPQRERASVRRATGGSGRMQRSMRHETAPLGNPKSVQQARSSGNQGASQGHPQRPERVIRRERLVKYKAIPSKEATCCTCAYARRVETPVVRLLPGTGSARPPATRFGKPSQGHRGGTGARVNGADRACRWSWSPAERCAPRAAQSGRRSTMLRVTTCPRAATTSAALRMRASSRISSPASRRGLTVDAPAAVYQSVMDSRKSRRRSSALAGRGDSLVTVCCGRVPATSWSTSPGP
jgi:hypothetical protein